MSFTPLVSFLKKRVFPFLLAGGLAGCNNPQPQAVASPAGYDLAAPKERKLPIELDEISGLFYHAPDSSLFAIQDERGLLYKIFPDKKVPIERWSFADGGDFEDVAIWGNTFYVLNSNGNIIHFQFGMDGEPIGKEALFPFPGNNEFEAIYPEPESGKLILICKDCKNDKKKEITTFTFDLKTFEYDTLSFKIDVQGVAGALGKKSIRFEPSASAIHPITGELYIVSSVNKMLIVCNRQGLTQATYKLPVQYFKQPEGIAFSPAGTLYISNEAADIGVANILIFDYQRPNTQNQK